MMTSKAAEFKVSRAGSRYFANGSSDVGVRDILLLSSYGHAFWLWKKHHHLFVADLEYILQPTTLLVIVPS